LTGGLSDQKSVFAIHCSPSIEFTAKALLKTLSLWQSYFENALSSDERALALESLVNSYPFEFDSAHKRLGGRVEEYLYGVPVLSPEQYAKTLASYGEKEIRKAIQDRHTRNGWLVTVVGDASIIKNQLESEQKNLPEEQRLVISKTIQPDDLL
jgi:hypothetical protein